MAANANFISIREYLTADYEVDCDYVDGVLEERNLGEVDHSHLITLLIVYLYSQRERLQVKILPDVRVQVGATRFRVPDVALASATDTGQILTNPPLLCIEVLSPEDRLSRMRARVADYHTMGVPDVWIIDPKTRNCFQSTLAGEFYEPTDGVLKALEGQLNLKLEDLS